jgi:hypothetical protein
MIIKEHYRTREDGVELNRTYSDKGVKIQKVVVTWNGKRIKKDEFYDEAIDIEGAPYEYE